ncbi:bifunctional lytic transglycosylase/C40 family peptidase [Streptomyces sp. ITFR-16]|uniref:C40 family peptidase n=1 Tax=Streptomyces sp. ITFR-16 TaxID=3075198 RepID=UPI00288A2E70|nr:bifunctional lytic transglycosylase/C40 family peptidase [Streptomyces sp. ITFR-16]WNI20417.1 bifunctional lytic transglycosylase/C40 family peptidase [Streptomyces sp. ITFR-16]
MKVVVRTVAVVAAVILLAVVGLVSLVLSDDDAEATELAAGGGGLQGVPSEFRSWILKADAACDQPAMTPALLAAQLYQESKFKTSRAEATSSAGAEGPAQFMPATFATWGRDDDGNGSTSAWDIGDAVMAQGRMMCSLLKTAKASGLPGDIRRLALAGYNAGWGRVLEFGGVPDEDWAGGETHHYVEIIMTTMKRFEGPGLLHVSGSGTGAKALRKAATQMDTPYAWGGGGPQGPSTGFCDGTNGYLNGTCSASSTVGFDCSSLVQYAYWPDTKLPRTAAAQYGATANRPVARADLKPGDLLFWSRGGTSAIYHVALYAGDGRVLHAPRTGRTVSLAPLTSAMPESDYVGATRP